MVQACNDINAYINSSTGAMPVLYSLRDCVPLAFESLLMACFFILFAGQYYLIKSRTGRAKILIALASSSFFTLILSLFLALGQLVEFASVITFAFLSILFFILLLVSDKD